MGTPSAGRSVGAPTEPRAVPGPPRPTPGGLRGVETIPGADAAVTADAAWTLHADSAWAWASASDADSASAVRSGDDPDGTAEVLIEPGVDTVGGRAAGVERLPLADRADAFAALHDELRTRLEQGGDTRG